MIANFRIFLQLHNAWKIVKLTQIYRNGNEKITQALVFPTRSNKDNAEDRVSLTGLGTGKQELKPVYCMYLSKYLYMCATQIYHINADINWFYVLS